MDTIQQQHERAVIENFAHWHNETHGTSWTYAGRPVTATPDGLVRDADGRETPVEVGDAYYDETDAKMKWLPARGHSGPEKWSGINPDETLADELSRIVEQKAGKLYPAGTVLVLNVYPSLTTVEDMEHVRSLIVIPNPHVFAAIYLFGHFPEDVTEVPLGQLFGNKPAGFHGWRLG